MGTNLLQNLDGWDWAVLGAAVVVAVYTLTVLMNRHREKTVERLRSEVAVESEKPKNNPASPPPTTKS